MMERLAARLTVLLGPEPLNFGHTLSNMPKSNKQNPIYLGLSLHQTGYSLK